MKARRIALREAAERDIDDAIGYYFGEGGKDLALSFVDALEAALRHIGLHAESGSPRYANELDLPGLRFWRLKRFPHLVFYVDHSGYIDVWRVLHGQKDIPDSLQGIE